MYYRACRYGPDGIRLRQRIKFPARFQGKKRVPANPESIAYVEYSVERSRHMETVQIVLDKSLLEAADKAARQTKQNSSSLIRHALLDHLKRLHALNTEHRDPAA